MAGSRARFFYDEAYDISWKGHAFPCGKYRCLARILAAEESRRKVAPPVPAGREDLLLAHEASYLDRLEAMTADPDQGWFEFEAPCTPEVLDGFFAMTGGTIAAGRAAVARNRSGKPGFAVNLGGGFHHAFPFKGEGFCAVNDIAVMLRVLRKEGAIRRAAVLDLDVHQGNGTAVHFARDSWCFTCSIHQERNYPIKQRSDLDLGLPDGADNGPYLEALGKALAACMDFHPDLLCYVAGADPYENDRLGGLALDLAGLAERDRRVFDAFLGRGVPVVAVLAGGYAEREEEVVAIHLRMIREGLARDP